MAKEKERRALLDVYSGDRWRRKVTDMSDEQVVAIYLRLKQQGKIS